jgi:hypothetical protein
LVEELRLGVERDPDVEQLVLVVEAERRAFVPPLDVDVPAAEAAVVVREQEDRVGVAAACDVHLAPPERAQLVGPVAEEISADAVAAARRQPQDGAMRPVLEDDRRRSVPDTPAKELA